jgi:hypothetical protein
LSKEDGSFSASLQTPQTKGHAKFRWILKFFTNMAFHVDAMIDSPKLKKHYATDLFYSESPEKAYSGGILFAENFDNWQ